MAGAILTLNAGSSSLKFAAFTNDGAMTPLVRGDIEHLQGAPKLVLVSPGDGTKSPQDFAAGSYDAVVGELLAWLNTRLPGQEIVAAGHRIVHGGPWLDGPQRIDEKLLEELTALTPLAPLHQPHNLSPIRAIAAARPWLPQVACFDTSFHRTMPAVAARFALPRDYETMGVRRYGFHGLSYEYIAKRLDEVAPGIARKKVIVAHLGNGASLCALDGGISIDTTMGFSALDGLVMGTRCGALDPGVVLYLLEELRRSPKAVEDLLYQRSGLLGVSGITGDMRKLLESDDPRASEAIDLFVFHVVRNIAALAASLKGLDAVVFTAGIGENSPEIRRRVVAGLTWMGAELEDAANNAAALLISKPSSAVQLYVLPTNEEAIICRHTRTILAAI